VKDWTIRTKLTLWYAGSVEAVSLISVLLLYWGFVYTSYRSVDLLLREEAEALGNYLSLASRAGVPSYIARLVEEGDLFSGQNKYVQISNDKGRVLERSANLAEGVLALPAQTRGAVVATLVFPDSLPVRVLTLPVVTQAGERCFVQEGVSVEGLRASLHRLHAMLIFFLPGMLGLSILTGWLMARRVLRPIEVITREARTIEAQDLSRRLPVTHPQDEIGQLTGVLNSLLSRLEAAFAQMRRFTADAAHELRTPLAVLRCGMEVTVSKARSPAEHQEALATYIGEVAHLARIVDDLFALARADAGQQELKREHVSFSGLMRETCEQAELMAEVKALRVSLHVAEEVSVLGDRLRLKQLLFNLVDNAIKYTPAGGTVRLAVGREESWVTVTVEDSGIGIPAADLPHIFERFYRVEKARSLDGAGGGLGLSICQWITQAHGGHITVQSGIGKGSTFRVVLPVTPSP
jgi:heavy metal sensor kinase